MPEWKNGQKLFLLTDGCVWRFFFDRENALDTMTRKDRLYSFVITKFREETDA